MTASNPEISVVIPVFNEEENLETLHREIVESLEAYGREFEIIAVDDGSKDGSVEVLRGINSRDKRLRIVRLTRNFGQNPALYAGFAHVRGQIVVTLDADLQNPPSEIPKLVDKLEEGYDIAQSWREDRQDNIFRRLASHSVNKAVSYLTETDVHDLGAAMKAFRRDIIEELSLSTHHSRYLPAETAWLGAKVGEVKTAHRERTAGESKYGFWALLRVGFDMIASISAAPVRLISIMGGLFSLIGFAMAARLIYIRLFTLGNINQIQMVLALFFIMAGVQMFCTSIMCEYISRIYTEVQRRPYYIISEIIE